MKRRNDSDMTKIVLTNTNCSWNKGSAAQVISTSKALKKIIPGAEFTLISCYLEQDYRCNKYGINIVGYSCRKKRKGYFFLFYLIRSILLYGLWLISHKVNLKIKINERILKEYMNADLIINLAGDSFSGGIFSVSTTINLSIMLGILLHKPTAIYSQSIGPFKFFTKKLSKLCLKKVNLIIVREEITKRYLEKLGISEIHLAADCAFLLEPDIKSIKKIFEREGIIKNIDSPFIGISVSEFMGRLNKKYVTIMQKVVNYLIEKFNAQVIFVPHVIGTNGGYDDRDMGEKILTEINDKNMVKLIRGDYSPEQLKGIIGEFNLFIGSRMHANIASTTMYVPTVAIGWSHKYYGIMKMLGQENYVCDLKKMTFEELCSKINDAWTNREEIRNELISKVKIAKKSSLSSIYLLKDLLDK